MFLIHLKILDCSLKLIFFYQIANHAYDKSRFLRGAQIDEAQIADADVDAAVREAQPLRYLHPEHTTIHLLDKPLSFDDAQQAIYRRPRHR